jgi:hypothetical protein
MSGARGAALLRLFVEAPGIATELEFAKQIPERSDDWRDGNL